MKAAAHIVTGQARALGDPEIIIMTRADETGAAEVIERHPLGESLGSSDWERLLREPAPGWQATSAPMEVDQGYFILDVEKSP